MGKLKGRVAIVTGAAGGLGKAYAKGLAREGASIVVNDVVSEMANQTVREITDAGGKAIACVGGVGTKETAEKLVDVAVEEFSALHILINNAGMTRDAYLVKMKEENWDAVMNVHLKGSFLNTQAAVKYMIDNGVKGRIINITSAAGIYGNIGQANYCAAKAGIIGLTKSNARELARFGICVNAVAPMGKTAMTEAMPDKIKEAIYNRLAQKITVQRMAEPEDVVPTIIFLASDESYFVTGQVIEVQGSVGFEVVST